MASTVTDGSPDMVAVVEGRARLSVEQAVHLHRHASLHDLGRWSTAVAVRKVSERYGEAGSQPPVRTYIIDRNINYTNVCSARCTFCAFYRKPGDAEGYILSHEQLHQKIQELIDIGGTQVLLQGGMHPDLPLEFYEEMLRGIKAKFPSVHVHGFSPPEFVEFVAVFDLPGFPRTKPAESDTLPAEVWRAKLEAIMRRLMAAGLDSIPGGGGEIFEPAVRRRIGLGKASAEQWLDVMACGHRLGMHTSATMMFGHIEGVRDRFNHIERVRQMQDRAIEQNWPGRYVSFIAWPFQRENTPLGRLPDWDGPRSAAGADGADSTFSGFPGDVLAEAIAAGKVDANDKQACLAAAPDAGKVVRMAGADEYLRTQAIARLMLDNVYSIGSSWVTMGPKIGQLALFFGANDMGSVMMEENVVSAAGTTYCLDEAFLCHLIRTAGFTPAQRDNRYNLLKVYPTPRGESGGTSSAPDLSVTDWSKHRVAKLHIETPGANPPEHDHDHAPAPAATDGTCPTTGKAGVQITLSAKER